MAQPRALLLALLAAPLARALRPRGSSAWQAPPATYGFRHFVQDFNRSYTPGSDEWNRREGIFEGRLREVRAFFAGPVQTWRKGITNLMDYTDSEYTALLGYRGRRGRRGGAQVADAELSLVGRHGDNPVQVASEVPKVEVPPLPEVAKVALPDVYTVNFTGSVLNPIVRDQGMCGSCWAMAAMTVLEGHLERSSETMAAMRAILKTQGHEAHPPTLSSQAMVSCTPNPRHCGGTGGCAGATSELGFEMVKKRGMPLAVSWPYASGAGQTPSCRDQEFAAERVGIADYTVLPTNKLHPLKQALVEAGAPIVVSVDATSWMMYSGGIYTDNGNEFTVNHAVALVAYTEPKAGRQGYWRIKNSWGEFWGESGYIRLEMKSNEEEHCGMDRDTHIGLACDGDPNEAWVCGTCGVLYDSSFPTGVHVKAAGQ